MRKDIPTKLLLAAAIVAARQPVMAQNTEKLPDPKSARADICDDIEKDAILHAKNLLRNGSLENHRNNFNPKPSNKALLEDAVARTMETSACLEETYNNMLEQGYPAVITKEHLQQLRHKESTKGEKSSYVSAAHEKGYASNTPKVAVIKKIPGTNDKMVKKFENLFLHKGAKNSKFFESKLAEQMQFVGDVLFSKKNSVRYSISNSMFPAMKEKGSASLSSNIVKDFVNTFENEQLSKDQKKFINKAIDQEAKQNGGHINFSKHSKHNSELANVLIQSIFTIAPKNKAITNNQYGPLRIRTNQGHAVGIEFKADAGILNDWAQYKEQTKYAHRVEQQRQNHNGREL